ncbi:MAG: hypothetical protein F6K04_26670 [Leptolyngbya sp. SIO4C5]|nr:hypothetical protein [Leptolyngbya sp. SIO4C5]
MKLFGHLQLLIQPHHYNAFSKFPERLGSVILRIHGAVSNRSTVEQRWFWYRPLPKMEATNDELAR